MAGLFSLARRRLRRLGVEVFFGPLESPGTCAEAQWFANSAWTSAKDTSRLAERLGSNRMWQACASLWLAAAELLEAACGLTADAGASGRDQLRHWRTLSYILGGMAALEAREGLAGENEGDINDAADEETR